MTIASIKIVNFERPPTVLWEKPLYTEAEYRAVKDMCYSGRSIFFLHCWLFPVRTNNLCNFAQDFFFPALYHTASQVDSCVKKYIEKLVYFLIDLITFPIRVITCIPRAIYNARQKEHALLTYLKQSGIDTGLIATDHVRVNLTANFGKESQYKEKSIIADEERIITDQDGELTVHFVEVPEVLKPGGVWTSILKSSVSPATKPSSSSPNANLAITGTALSSGTDEAGPTIAPAQEDPLQCKFPQLEPGIFRRGSGTGAPVSFVARGSIEQRQQYSAGFAATFHTTESQEEIWNLIFRIRRACDHNDPPLNAYAESMPRFWNNLAQLHRALPGKESEKSVKIYWNDQVEKILFPYFFETEKVDINDLVFMISPGDQQEAAFQAPNMDFNRQLQFVGIRSMLPKAGSKATEPSLLVPKEETNPLMLRAYAVTPDLSL